MNDDCARCGRDHGCGPKPWSRVPAWVWLCDDCMADRMQTPMSTPERIIVGMRRLPMTDGPRVIAAQAGLAESTVRRHLPAIEGTVEVGRYGWWTLSGEGIRRAERIVGVEAPNRNTFGFGGHAKIETEVEAA